MQTEQVIQLPQTEQPQIHVNYLKNMVVLALPPSETAEFIDKKEREEAQNSESYSEKSVAIKIQPISIDVQPVQESKEENNEEIIEEPIMEGKNEVLKADSPVEHPRLSCCENEEAERKSQSSQKE